jgi:hypothetical protein
LEKYQPKKWCCETVVEMLFPFFFGYMVEFGGNQQNTKWIKGKTIAHHNNYETDKKEMLSKNG